MSTRSSSRSCVSIYINDEKTSTRNKLTSYVRDALGRAGEQLQRQRGVTLKHFNEDTVRKGVPLLPEIEKTIKESWISIVIISNAFACEECLDQLVIILKQKREKGDAYMVLPIFYLVTPTEVGDQDDGFASVFVNLKRKFGAKADAWAKALAEVVQLGGHVVLPNKSESDIVALIVEDVLKHVDWLCTEGFITITSSEKSLIVEASPWCSKKLRDSHLSTVRGEDLSIGEEKAEWDKNVDELPFCHLTISPRKLGSEEITDYVVSKENRNQSQCIGIKGCGSDDSIFNGCCSGIISSASKESVQKESILEALLKLKTFFSEDLDGRKLEDLSDGIRILGGLTEVDGINIVERMRLSFLEKDLAANCALIHSTAEGRKEIDLAIQKFDQQSDKFRQLSEEYDTVKKSLRELDSRRETLKAKLAAVKRSRERCFQQRCGVIDSLNSHAIELKKLEDADLPKQKLEVKELRQAACERWEICRKLIDGLISKFTTATRHDCR